MRVVVGYQLESHSLQQLHQPQLCLLRRSNPKLKSHRRFLTNSKFPGHRRPLGCRETSCWPSPGRLLHCCWLACLRSNIAIKVARNRFVWWLLTWWGLYKLCLWLYIGTRRHLLRIGLSQSWITSLSNDFELGEAYVSCVYGCMLRPGILWGLACHNHGRQVCPMILNLVRSI